MTSNVTPDAVTDLQEQLADHPHVANVEPDITRRPVRLVVTLTGSRLTPGVKDLLDDHHATIEYADADDTLELELLVDGRVRDAGQNQLRLHGNTSVVLAITPSALELSGFEVGDTLSLAARDGIVRLSTQDD